MFELGAAKGVGHPVDHEHCCGHSVPPGLDGGVADLTTFWQNPFDDAWTVSSLLDEASVLHGQRVALFSESHGSLTHGQIRERASRLRGAIRQIATANTRTVACLASLNAPLYIAAHAIFTSGFGYAALEPDAPDSRNLMCLDDCGADIIIADSESEERAERLAEGKRRIIRIEQALEAGPAVEAVRVDPAAPAAFIFTSGSTGRPKAVVRSHRSLAHAIYCLGKNYRYGPTETMLYPGSPGHVGSLNDVLSCLLTGMKSVPNDIRRIDFPTICRLLAEHQVTILAMPPSLLRLLLRELSPIRHRLSLDRIIASGEPLLRSDIALCVESVGERCKLWQNYGSTETGPMYAGSYTLADAAGSGPLPLRTAHHGCRIEIVTDGSVVPAGETGSIRVRSSYLADGYLNAPAEQAARFGADAAGPYFDIGDQASLSGDGALQVHGREDRQIKLHGRRLELGDVESAILTDRTWSEAVVVQARTAGSGTSGTLVGLLRSAAAGGGDVQGLRERLAGKLPLAAIPRRFVVVPELPRTTTGKVDLAAAQRLAEASVGARPAGKGGPPQGVVENWIADCWEYVLGVTQPGREDSFLDLGGDSLAAIELAIQLEKRAGVRLAIDRIMQHPTIAEQVVTLESVRRVRPSPIIRLRSDGRGPVLVLFPGVGGHAWVFAELCRRLTVSCDILAVSLVDVMGTDGEELTHRALLDLVVTTIRDIEPTRRVVLGGYSFGAVIAAHLAGELEQAGGRSDRLLLLDPCPLVFGSLINLPLSVRQIRGLIRRVTNLTGQSEAEVALERQVNAMDRALSGLYRKTPKCPKELAMSVMLSSDGVRDLGKAAELFGRPLSGLDLATDPAKHLELMRPPYVDRTARWMESVLQQTEGATGELSAAG